MKYWHMQLHPGEFDSWDENDIKNLLEKGLIGCAGDPVNIFNEIRIGDIVMIRHGGSVIGLVRVEEEARPILAEEKIDGVWYDRCAKVTVLKYYNDLNISGNGWFIPKTLMSVDNEIAYNFINKLYIDYNSENRMKRVISILENKKQIILQGPPGTGKTFTAKDIAQQIIFSRISKNKDEQKRELEKSEQFKLIQFHPAYSYEDFVRGISAKLNGVSIEYKSENKVFGEFIQRAFKNYSDSKKDNAQVRNEVTFDINFEVFKIQIQNELDNNGPISLTNTVNITYLDDDAFIFQGSNWGGRLLYSQVKKLFLYNIQNREQVSNFPDIAKHVIHRTSYYFPILQMFRNAFPDHENHDLNIETATLKKYVLVIDEFNRANLPAVLGELIYALEYRGESIDSIYDIEGDRSLIIPPNLYIIGTMNTSDRSVGHIDYAIRRRFAFVDVESSSTIIGDVLSNDNSLKEKALKLYDDVSQFFKIEKIASDFKVKDIQLGHSYFLAKTEEELELKLEYEIKPLLIEYLKDGILLSRKSENGEDLTESEINNLKIG